MRRREGSFHCLQFLFQPVLGFKLGPRRGHCSDRKKGKRLLPWWMLHLPQRNLSKLTVSGDRAMPVSSRLAHARTAAIAAPDAATDARHEASVRRAYVTLGLKKVARIATLPFPAYVDKAAGAQQLTR